MEITLEALGLTREELAGRVIDKAVEQLLDATHLGSDDMGVAHYEDGIASQIHKMAKEAINGRIEAIGNEHVIPRVQEMIDNIVLQATNKWGESVGRPLTTIEYFILRVEAYIQEPVDYHGKTKAESSYNWSAHSTRIAQMIDAHLQHHISIAVADALKELNSNVAKGLAETVKLEIKNVLDRLRVDVKGR